MLCRIPKNKNIPNTSLRYLNFVFLSRVFSTLIISKEDEEKVGKPLHCRLFLETTTRFQSIKMENKKCEMKSILHFCFQISDRHIVVK